MDNSSSETCASKPEVHHLLYTAAKSLSKAIFTAVLGMISAIMYICLNKREREGVN